MTVVERDLGRRAHDGEHARRIEPEARRARRGRARARRGSTPPSAPGSGAPWRWWRRAGRAAPAGSTSGATTRVAAREPSVCWARGELVVVRVRRGHTAASERRAGARARRARGRGRSAAARPRHGAPAGASPSRGPSPPGRRPRVAVRRCRGGCLPGRAARASARSRAPRRGRRVRVARAGRSAAGRTARAASSSCRSRPSCSVLHPW